MHFRLIFLIAVAALVPDPKPARLSSAPLSPRQLNYRLQVELMPQQKELRGKLELRIRNVSKVPIKKAMFHLYLNAFSGPETLFMKISRGKMRRSYADPKQPGWIKIDSASDRYKKLHDGTVMELLFKHPLSPGQDRLIKIDFTSRLPKIFARTGHAHDLFMAAQPPAINSPNTESHSRMSHSRPGRSP